MGTNDIQVGDVFGRLTVIGEARKMISGQIRTAVECLCSCGSPRSIRAEKLVSGHTRSCGCLKRELSRARRLKHGEPKKSPEYGAWCGMKTRCLNPKGKNYKNYGARGITVCARWADSFESFLADMGRRPDPALMLERIDNNGNYEPGNCKWATRSEQMRNRRCAKLCELQVIGIMARWLQGASQRQIGREFQVSGVMVGDIVNGRNWSSLFDPSQGADEPGVDPFQAT